MGKNVNLQRFATLISSRRGVSSLGWLSCKLWSVAESDEIEQGKETLKKKKGKALILTLQNFKQRFTKTFDFIKVFSDVKSHINFWFLQIKADPYRIVGRVIAKID